jgi:hypothetical protein
MKLRVPEMHRYLKQCVIFLIGKPNNLKVFGSKYKTKGSK